MSSSKISSGADLEARIAELDDRLRQARADNDALKRRMSPSPQAPARDGSVSRVFESPPVLQNRLTSARRVDPHVPHSPSNGMVLSPVPQVPRAPVIQSPWSDVARDAAKTSDEETSRIYQQQRIATSALENRISDKHSYLSQTHAAAHQTESDISAQRRQKEVFVADSQRALDDAERRLIHSERLQQELAQQIQTANEKRLAVSRQVEEIRGAVSRAELRHVELSKDEADLRSKLHEVSVSSREKHVGSHAEEQFSNTLKLRLEQRVAELEEENTAASERLRRLEQQFSAQQSQWSQNEDALQREAEAANKLLHDVQTRLALLEEELRHQEEEADRIRRARQDRTEQLAAQRAHECEREIDRVRREGFAREEQLRREQEEALNILRNELEETMAQVEKKRRGRDEQQQVVDDLRVQLAQLQADAEKRSARASECETLESEVAAMQEQLAATLREVEQTKTDIVSREEEVARLKSVARTLTTKVAEERRLREVVAELAMEVHETQTLHESELASLERQEADQAALVDEAKRALVRANEEIDRISGDASIELGMLSRNIAALRQNVSDKENALNALIAENASKQATIAQFEEEKRRLERDQIARKAAAAQATKAALAELNSY